MTAFYCVGHNTFETRGFPWVTRTEPRPDRRRVCEVCGHPVVPPLREVHAILEPEKGVKWPDVLGCGAEATLFIVSDRVITAWREEGVGDFPRYRVWIDPPLPKKLEGTEPPVYWHLDGDAMRGALLDFEASGFVDIRYCPACGTRSYDVFATGQRQKALKTPYVFKPGSWNGTHVFTTDLSDAAFFCTDFVVDCARKYRLTNFRFTPIEWGPDTSRKGIKYLK